MVIGVFPADLDLAKIPDGLRVGGSSGPLLGSHGGIGNFPGTWTGRGFNLIWRPHFSAPGAPASDHFLQLNLTSESIEFASVGGPVPNRGSNEKDIAIYAIRYLQQIHDANFPTPLGGGGLHWSSRFRCIEVGNELLNLTSELVYSHGHGFEATRIPRPTLTGLQLSMHSAVSQPGFESSAFNVGYADSRFGPSPGVSM
jgi:hypothetical protein